MFVAVASHAHSFMRENKEILLGNKYRNIRVELMKIRIVPKLFVPYLLLTYTDPMSTSSFPSNKYTGIIIWIQQYILGILLDVVMMACCCFDDSCRCGTGLILPDVCCYVAVVSV
jgi:hypothetical protein